MKNILLILSSIIYTSCWLNSHDPAISDNYNFNHVGSVFIEKIEDFSGSPKSGEMVFANLTHNFLKLGYEVNQASINISDNTEKLILSCVITEFTDSKMIVVPYRHEDRGYTKTIVEQSTTNNDKNEKSELDQKQTSTTTTHAGKIKEGNRVEYTHSRVGIILKMTDYNSGGLVWSNSYWYSGLEIQKTIELCVRTGINQINKILNHKFKK